MSSVTLVKDIKSNFEGGSFDSYPAWLTVFDDKVFFTAVDNSGELELWATDGTEIGTNLISNLAGSMSGDPHELTAGRYSLTYSAFTVSRGRELWYTTQSPYSTGPIEDINIGSSSSNPKNIIYWYDAPVFSAKDNDGLRYLWRSDIVVEKISMDHILPTESLITEFNNDVYFVGSYQEKGDALWKYDGNAFTEIFDYYPDTNEDTVIREIRQSGDLLYFTASSVSRDGLYSTDGTPENTRLIESGESTGTAFSGADNLIDVDGTLYFTATASYGKDLWKIDDSSAKAIVVDPLNKQRGINRADHLTLVGDKIFYEGTYSFDSELWLYDVSQRATRIVKEINAEGDSLERVDNTFTPFGDRLLFVARDQLHGEELWITNGHESGTYRLTDLMDGEADSEIGEITVLDDKVIFSSNSDDFGKELFVWDSNFDSGVSSPSIPEPSPETEPAPETEPDCTNSTDVFRFYNAGTGVHFFTPSPGERDDIISRPEWGYKYEGVAYKAPTDIGTELYRFYNRDKGYHFVTASKAEADFITGKHEWGYRYEGRSCNVTQKPTSEASNEVHRFYNPGKGNHFYSASDSEAENIIAMSLGSGYDLSNALKEDDLLPNGWGYIYEGAAWYVTDC